MGLARAVATVSTKADLRFDFMKADFIPDWVKENIFNKVWASSSQPARQLVRTPRERGTARVLSE